jgi:hypothetical protein
LSERDADGIATKEEMESAILGADEAVESILRTPTPPPISELNIAIPAQAAQAVLALARGESEVALQHVFETGCALGLFGSSYNGWVSSIAQTRIGSLRDVFGNPFRPVTVNPTWQTATVVSLAQAIYDERAFDRMPILADALEDAGCTNADVLNHCRQPGEHVRGCWVVDLLLGKQ